MTGGFKGVQNEIVGDNKICICILGLFLVDSICDVPIFTFFQAFTGVSKQLCFGDQHANVAERNALLNQYHEKLLSKTTSLTILTGEKKKKRTQHFILPVMCPLHVMYIV